MVRHAAVVAAAGAAIGLGVQSAQATMSFTFTDPAFPGLAAEADFTLVNPTTMQIELRNTSTGVPVGFDSADQILTGISWDFAPPGMPADTWIVGGSTVIGPTSMSVNFDAGLFGPGDDVSGEWGFGNMDGTGALWNFVSANAAGTGGGAGGPFGGPNLDGPESVDGPQGGLVAAGGPLVPLGGLGAIQHEVIITVSLGGAPLSDLNFLKENLVRVEFGSDAAFITVPTPGALALFGLGGMLFVGRRRR